jgi:hypothetical protein
VSEHRATVKMGLDIYGQHYEHEMWINWNPDEAGCDSRVADWYADRYADALNKSYLAGDDQQREAVCELSGCSDPSQPRLDGIQLCAAHRAEFEAWSTSQNAT